MHTESVFPVFETWPSWPFRISTDRNTPLSRWLRGELIEGTGTEKSSMPWSPAMDIYETPEGSEFCFDLPGIDPAKVEISALGNTLVIKGGREQPAKGEDAVPVVQESPCGPFVRKVALPSDLDGLRAKATHKHGVLVITVPKKEEAKARSIPIESN